MTALGFGPSLVHLPNDFKSRIDFTALLEQRGRLLQLRSALPTLALVPERLVLREAVNACYELQLDAIGASAYFELKALVGEELSVTLLQADGAYKPWHGHVVEAAQLGSDGGFARYRLVMRPWLAWLERRRDAQVFTEQSTRQICEAIFQRYPGAHWRWEAGELPARTICLQYRETDLAFVQRLLAEDGLSYHFEHLAQGQEQEGRAKHVLVVTDRTSERPALGTARYTSQHPTANVFGQKDAVTAFSAQRHVRANAVALGHWNESHLAGEAAEERSALDAGELPTLEVYDGSRTGCRDAVEARASLALAALDLDVEHFEGQGSTRHFEAGSSFTLIDHPLFGANATAFNNPSALLHERQDNAFTLLAIEHHAANNLGAHAAELLGSTELERGSYKNHFHAARKSTPLVPRFIPKPTAPGLQTATVVGVSDEAVHTDREQRVRIRYAWQRDEAASLWVRVAQAAAGANWGQVFVPRVGSEVNVGFVEGDIDRPLVTGGLYNGHSSPPFAAGEDSGVNHPGVIDGWHSKALDGAGHNEWTSDQASGQLRMRLHASVAASELTLGHLIQQTPANAQRGSARGSGFEAGTQGWAQVRSGKGLLVSTSARAGSYGSAQGTQMDAGEAITQLKSAKELGGRLNEAAQASKAQSLTTHDEALPQFIKAIDPQQDGKHTGSVNGQEAKKAQGRTLGDAVEAFAKPLVLLDTPSTSIWSSEASIACFAGQDWSFVAQGDIHYAAAQNLACVSGQATSWFTAEGGAKLIAANGPVSLQAHTDALSIQADQEVIVASVNDEITVSAKTRIELIAGTSSIVLDGGNIDFACPALWESKGSMQAFLSGAQGQAELPALPQGRLNEPLHDIEVNYQDERLRPMDGMPYRIVFDDGTSLAGKLDGTGRARHEGVPNEGAKVYFGEADPPFVPGAAQSLQIDDDALEGELSKLGLDAKGTDVDALIESQCGRAHD